MLAFISYVREVEPSHYWEEPAAASAVAESPDPRTGATALTPDPLEWIHRITALIPDPGRLCQWFDGAYSNRSRVVTACPEGENTDAAAGRCACPS